MCFVLLYSAHRVILFSIYIPTRFVVKNKISIISQMCKEQAVASYINFCMLRTASDSPTLLQALFLNIYTLAVLVHVHTERYRK